MKACTFNLRLAFLAITVVAVLCALYSARQRQLAEVRDAVRVLREDGFIVHTGQANIWTANLTSDVLFPNAFVDVLTSARARRSSNRVEVNRLLEVIGNRCTTRRLDFRGKTKIALDLDATQQCLMLLLPAALDFDGTVFDANDFVDLQVPDSVRSIRFYRCTFNMGVDSLLCNISDEVTNLGIFDCENIRLDVRGSSNRVASFELKTSRCPKELAVLSTTFPNLRRLQISVIDFELNDISHLRALIGDGIQVSLRIESFNGKSDIADALNELVHLGGLHIERIAPSETNENPFE